MEHMELQVERSSEDIIDTGTTTVADTEAKWMMCEIGRETFLTYYMKKGDFVYSILATATGDDFLETRMRRVARSFRFE